MYDTHIYVNFIVPSSELLVDGRDGSSDVDGVELDGRRVHVDGGSAAFTDDWVDRGSPSFRVDDDWVHRVSLSFCVDDDWVGGGSPFCVDDWVDEGSPAFANCVSASFVVPDDWVDVDGS